MMFPSGLLQVIGGKAFRADRYMGSARLGFRFQKRALLRDRSSNTTRGVAYPLREV